MEWKFRKNINTWDNSQEKNSIILNISIMQGNSDLLIMDLDDKEHNLYFSLSIGKEKETDAQEESFLDKDSVSSEMQELEELFDIEKWGDSPRKELFKELQDKIIKYFDNLYLDSPKNEE